ncbi:lytic polysaccharide monooxygenase [Streptomyces sp. NPDC058274]|uniref:lytic polysaccharide monooxygenase auxiliary activity family 9 protein n=1 Tax=Streptomyces sp. NPDC058274 TaxID=3346416 RepID=UPI0036EB7B93
MTAHRTAAAAAVAVAAPLLLTTWAAGPAQAHGAPTDPVSRVVACSPEGGSRTGSAACRAAIAANGAPFTAWDNLRVGGVNGQDRRLIPDGQLCSGGLPAYKGLDLARTDWPSTRLTPGAPLTLAYSSTIPHTGTFKLFLTKPGYDPTKPLKWSDLPTTPFATATDPSLVNGAYRIKAKLPADRSGHHVLYTIWQNSSTADTYYSCSDVVFPQAGNGSATGAGAGSDDAAGAGAGAAAGRRTPTASKTPSPSKSAAESAPASRPPATPTADQGAAADRSEPVADSSSSNSAALPLIAGGAAALALAAGLAVRLRRRPGR